MEWSVWSKFIMWTAHLRAQSVGITGDLWQRSTDPNQFLLSPCFTSQQWSYWGKNTFFFSPLSGTMTSIGWPKFPMRDNNKERNKSPFVVHTANSHAWLYTLLYHTHTQTHTHTRARAHTYTPTNAFGDVWGLKLKKRKLHIEKVLILNIEEVDLHWIQNTEYPSIIT